jgi:hypothetical protein
VGVKTHPVSFLLSFTSVAHIKRDTRAASFVIDYRLSADGFAVKVMEAGGLEPPSPASKEQMYYERSLQFKFPLKAPTDRLSQR